jgi:Bacterial mobilisation protein (MobC)
LRVELFMDAERKLPLSHAPKSSGSDTRRKQRIVNFRATAEEYAVVEQAAKSAGLTIGSYIRQTMLAAPKTRSRRAPRADVFVLAKLIAELNRIGGNINQITRASHYGEQPERAWLKATLGLLLRTMKCVRSALGFES